MTATERIKILRSRDFAHGTRAAYKGGCKCLLCRAANSRYNTAREAARKHGDTRDLVSAEPVVRHLRKLAARGVGYKSVAAAASLSDSTLFQLRSGQRTHLRAHHARAILAVDAGAIADHALVDAGPTWRKLNALIEDGYTKAQIARWLGKASGTLQFRSNRVRAKTEADVERLCVLIEQGRVRRDR